MERRHYWGIFFLFIQAVIILRNYFIGYNYFFWFCDFVPLLFAISFFIGNNDVIKGLINFGLIPQVIFLIDFIFVVSRGASPLGLAADVVKLNSFFVLVTIFTHLTTLLALLLTFKIKPTKKTLLYSFGFMFAVYVLTLIFTPSEGYINYVYSLGNLLRAFNFTILNTVWSWPIFTFLLVILPTHGIQYLLYRLSNKNIKSKRMR